MNLYSPIIFKNKDKRIDLPDVLAENADKEDFELDNEAVELLKEIHKDE